MDILLTVLSSVDGSFVTEKTVNLPYYYAPLLKDHYLPKDSILEHLDPIFSTSNVEFLVEF